MLLASIGAESIQIKLYHQAQIKFVLYLIFSIKIFQANITHKNKEQSIQWYSAIMMLDLLLVALMAKCEVLIFAHLSFVIFFLIKDLNNKQSYKQI